MKHEKSNWRETSSSVLQEEMVGREGNKKDIIDLLLNDDNSHQNVSLVAIVGIGGLGKTALAQLVYNDADVERSFHKRIWVCVSQGSDVNVLVKLMLESLLKKEEKDNQGRELLENKLKLHLDGQKFLLVLDDIWDDFPRKWEELKKVLMCGAEGSQILLTTRDQAIVKRMGIKTPYLLEGLNNDQSWTLLKRLAFDDDKIMTPNLESVGQKIAEKCKGVPLAVRVMGGLLRSKLRETDWEDLLKRDFWKPHDNNDLIMPILKLSYDSLATELKQCFAYCSLYPKDWEYEKDELIDMWMAQGFLENKDEAHCLEDVGEEYVRVLLMKSFLQDVKTDESEEIKYFKMHDLMHDLSQSVAASFDIYIEGGKDVPRCPRHALSKNYDSSRLLNVLNLGRLRTFHEMKKTYGRDQTNLFVLKCLRSLDLSNCGMRYLSKSIGKMIHLRHLNLYRCYHLTCLPKSFGNLVNLQTFRLTRCVNLKFSGDIITKLVKLRRLDILGCKAFDDGMPMGLGKMTCMQRLSHFIVGNDDKEIKKAKLNELKDLDLKGRLAINKLDSVRDVEEESKNINLKTKKNLISLSLDWGDDPKMEKSDAMQLLENLHPHQNLKTLEINRYPGVCLSDWLLSCANLVQLEFFESKNCQYLPALEGFVSLKTLHIEGMDKLECIYYKGCSSSANFFPSLVQLTIDTCRSLRGWQREANVQNTRDNEWHDSLPPFSHLSALEIRNCPNLRCMPTFPNLARHLELINSSIKPLVDTLRVSTIGPSTSHDMTPSLSMLKSLHIGRIEMEALPEEWMQNLSSLKHLYIVGFSSLEKPFLHMQNLSATLEKLSIFKLDSQYVDEDYNMQCQDLCCLHSLQTIEFVCCDHLMALPEWICDLQSLRVIEIWFCANLKSFPAEMSCLTNLQTLRLDRCSLLLKEICQKRTGAEWLKIHHIPNILIDGCQS
ncbi:putative disease resistance protein RGA1 isoform X2 [Neltuma alba]|nr:putative disease resistance protein RGA1 isoform X2 [Prosopis alba]